MCRRRRKKQQEDTTPFNQADINASSQAFKNFQKGMKNKITGDDLYKLAPGVTLPKV